MIKKGERDELLSFSGHLNVALHTKPHRVRAPDYYLDPKVSYTIKAKSVNIIVRLHTHELSESTDRKSAGSSNKLQ